jgi:Protein of unknown function (DUF3037)
MDARLRLPFEAVAVRYVHDVRTEEFLNIGIVMLCAKHPFAGARFLPQWGRITAAFPGADYVLLRRIARAFERRCAEWSAEAHGQLSLQPITELGALMRSVMAPDDASIQFSPVISGVTADPERTLAELFTIYVASVLPKEEHATRDDGDVWRDFAVTRLPNTSLLKKLQRHVLYAPHYELPFDNAWKNGTWNVAQPVSFDLLDPRAIRDKATSWTGKLLTVKPHELDTNVYLLIGMPPKDSPAPVRAAANDALAILEDNVSREAKVLTEDSSEKLAKKITEDLATHGDE